MKKVLAILGLVVMLIVLTTACQSSQEGTLRVYNWGDYIDKSVLEAFEEQTNIRVIYEEFATNEDMYAKIKAGGSEYDVVVPSDYMIKRMINEGLLQKIDSGNVPNAELIEKRFKNLAYDPKNEYSVPYMWGTVGIIYNKKMVTEPIDSWTALWDEKYAKQILMIDSQRDAIGLTLKMLGYSLNSRDPVELEAAKQKLFLQKPLVLAYVGDEVKDKMIAGEAALAVVWSGDAVYMQWENEDLEYVIPKEGSNIWFDALAIPASSKHKQEAEQFINFMCKTETAFKNADYIGYATPHAEAIKQLPSELTEDKTYYPGPEDLKNSEVFEDLTDTLALYDRIWTEVKAK